MKNNSSKSERLARNYIWNLLGIGLPALVGLLTTPVLISEYGLERFGVLTIIWAVIGYLSFFDFGISRALTKLVAERIGDDRVSDIPRLIWTAELLVIGAGLLGVFLGIILIPWLTGSLLNIPIQLQQESRTAFFLLTAAIPVVGVATGLRGVLEAYQDFGPVNVVRIPLGLITFLGPLAVLQFTENLIPAVAILITFRLISLIAYGLYLNRRVRGWRNIHKLEFPLIREILGFGSWMTVSNLVSPFLVSVDRFFIGAVLSMSAVAFYTTPFDVVTKISLLSSALIRVLYPSFASANNTNQQQTWALFGLSIKYLLLVLFPISFLVIVFAREGLGIWLGESFASQSTQVAQLLMLGVFINSFAQIPFGLIQSLGRPDLTAKLLLLELPIYMMILFWAVGSYGIEGAAAVWSMRVLVDTLVLFFLTKKLIPVGEIVNLRILITICVLGLTFTVGFFLSEIYLKLGFSVLVLCGFFPSAWFLIMNNRERGQIRTTFRSMLPYNDL